MTRDSFDRWMSRQAPDGRRDPQDVRHLRDRIGDQLRHRHRARQTRGTTLAAAAVVLVVLTAAQVPRLGSNNRATFIAESRPDLVQHPMGQRTVVAAPTTQRDFETYLDRGAARMLAMVGSRFFQVGDEVNWAVDYVSPHDPEMAMFRTNPTADQQFTMTRETTMRLLPWMDTLDAEGPEAHGTELPAIRARIDGHDLWFRRWNLFFLACRELFAFGNGQEWLVAHYLFRKR